MGQWNRRRWWSRKRNFYQEDHQDKHSYNENQIEPSEYEDNIPSWEKQFCKFASVPWGKVLFVKKYMHMHEEIVKWNDSSGEEAFNDAKQRFWAHINGIPCDICLPDPDMYIDKNIDWNTSIDPELIASLDLVFFDVDKTTDWNAANEKTTNSNQEQKMQSNVQNPWEPTDGAEKDAANEKTSISNQEPKMQSNVQNPWEPTDGVEKDVGTSWGQGHSQSNNKDSSLKDEKRWNRDWDQNNNTNNGEFGWEPTDRAEKDVGTSWGQGRSQCNNKESSLKEEKRWNRGWDQNNNTNNGGFGWEPTDGAEKDVGTSWGQGHSQFNNKESGLKEEKRWNNRGWDQNNNINNGRIGREPTKSGYDNGWGDYNNGGFGWEPTDGAVTDVGTSWGQGHSQSNNKESGLKEEKRWNNRGWDQNNNINNGRIGRESTKSGYDNGWRDYNNGYNNNNNQWGNSNKDFIRPNGRGWRPANDNSSRKREWTDQDASRYKSFRSYDRSNNNNWRGRPPMSRQ
ncbi:bifunctional endo-1,4-beta-xylanase XylA-like isoform X1 [Impatiens glandulifera]|uniref:bifunctional endo-1,4-beta-xylanase XylA-like isoform X1 n=1 Tax=Impatiens glandulifera TaxID=253017 RepID=UPI001FB148F3|nr:bifunctional endo-1,4-beta-xylanase XylA-like isoform X1 [Impatiens glandulifera]